jgi:hypothetical protein
VSIPPDELPREELLKLYGFAIDEYRFEVRLNADRTRDYVVINLGLLTLTSGLLRLESGRAGTAFLILVFAAAAATSVFGAKIVRKGHEYYKRAAVKKTLIENRLRLLKRLDPDAHRNSTLAIGTTPGMANIDRIRRAPDEWIAAGPSRGSIVFYAISMLWVLAAVNVAGAVITAAKLNRQWPQLLAAIRSVF